MLKEEALKWLIVPKFNMFNGIGDLLKYLVYMHLVNDNNMVMLLSKVFLLCKITTTYFAKSSPLACWEQH